ncbi:hypothetical protein BpHYR1_032111 [Brachionus plicatilis]|uniref:Uncharacterized protein n=1 Tax=Brachionus plicatilis TaxID=10195 RepID=A0A3M7RCW6_BRAPC|nr:hypothetical protein BpHYR1_032111 [Brachionus plicatilis]
MKLGVSKLKSLKHHFNHLIRKLDDSLSAKMNKIVAKLWKKTKLSFCLKFKKQTSNKLNDQNMHEQSLIEPSTPVIFKRPPHYISPITPLKIQNPNSKLKKQFGRVRLCEENHKN